MWSQVSSPAGPDCVRFRWIGTEAPTGILCRRSQTSQPYPPSRRPGLPDAPHKRSPGPIQTLQGCTVEEARRVALGFRDVLESPCGNDARSQAAPASVMRHAPRALWLGLCSCCRWGCSPCRRVRARRSELAGCAGGRCHRRRPTRSTTCCAGRQPRPRPDYERQPHRCGARSGRPRRYDLRARARAGRDPGRERRTARGLAVRRARSVSCRSCRT